MRWHCWTGLLCTQVQGRWASVLWQHWAVVKLMMSQSNTSFWCEAICICKIVGRKYISLSKIYGEVKRNVVKFQKSNARKKLFDQKGEIRHSFSIPWTCCWLASSLCFRICNHSNQHRYAECGDTICIATQLWTLPWVEGHGALGWRPWTPVAEVVGSL